MNNIKSDGFFLVRTPSLSISDYLAWQGDDNELKRKLANWLQQPKVNEALFLASPSLHDKVPVWEKAPDSKQGRKVGLALLKYYIRMHSRPTPFGLFSGVSKGEVSDRTQLQCLPTESDKRSTRLDMFYLTGIRDYLSKKGNLPDEVIIKPNSTLYLADNKSLRFIEPYQSNDTLSYQLSAAEHDEYVEKMLHLSGNGVSKSALVTQFMACFSDVEQNEVEEYVQALIEAGILVIDLPLPLTSEEPALALAKGLENSGMSRYADKLITTISALKKLDKEVEITKDNYLSVIEELRTLPFPVSPAKLFQVDVQRHFATCTVDSKVATSLEKTCSLLASVTRRPKNVLSEFITQFQRKYEGQYVPLTRLLDDESGISLATTKGYDSPLLAGMPLNHNVPLKSAKEQSPLSDLLAEKSCQKGQLEQEEMWLDRKELAKIGQPSDAKLPGSFGGQAALHYDTNTKEELIHFQGCYGPSAANFLGRFCHLDNDLADSVRGHLINEEKQQPEAVFAEVVHLPDGRPGNVIARPKLREYEIVFLADSDIEHHKQIQVNDLYVFVEEGMVRLWSKRLNKEIIPRMSCAHNFMANSLGVYRFLGMIQQQNVLLPQFEWPAAFTEAPRLPRVRIDNVILAPQSWLIDRLEFACLLDVTVDEFTSHVAVLCAKYSLPNVVVYALRDNALTLHLNSRMCIEALLSETKGQEKIKIQESLNHRFSPSVEEKGNEAMRYAHEIHFLFHNKAKLTPPALKIPPLNKLHLSSIKRRFMPGSEWLSLKIYGGNSVVENVLRDHLGPLIEKMKAEQKFSQWFFMRYSDPEWHIRLRFKGEPSTLLSQVLPNCSELLAPLIETGQVARFEVAPYDREVERYGGEKTISLAESCFENNSEYTLDVLKLMDAYGEEARWRAAMLGVDQLLSAFEYSLQDKLALITLLREGFGKEFNETAELRRHLGARHRGFSGLINSDLSRHIRPEGELQSSLYQLLEANKEPIFSLARHVLSLLDEQASVTKDELLASLLHMHNNRIFKAYNRQHELVIYDLLRRHYLGENSRNVNS
ncbi:lantibiotic dehydratase [Vibrio sp. Of7-15]|uniref:lantibiotic dehydratase n=1 Tax=Vibrio sp. Of7-15 TaxID=2724879 RepID=UPI001EF1694C|nr:lantibiotic dehydratase [Vibrio sp. Of7-15]MCG7498028.1 lantibiotic dehydratase [Vibrio sp. Of7-15]